MNKRIKNRQNIIKDYIVGDFFMEKRKLIKFIIIEFLLVSLLGVTLIFSKYENDMESIETLSKYGSRGSEVTQIQTKLKRWGYYSGSVDGIYGTQTVNAVKYFQRKNGLTVDGIAGPATLKAGNQPYEGQVAVGAVVMNRIKSSSFPNTLSGVVYQSGAFDAVKDGQVNLKPNDTARKAAQDAINGWDPSYGAIYYFNPSTATNKWIWSRPVTVTIGKHRFCK